MKIGYFWSKLMTKIRGKAVRGSHIDPKAFVNSGCNIVNSTVGRYSYCSYDCWVIETQIGQFCSIANNVHIGGPSHPIEFVSSSCVFHEGRNVFGTNIAELHYNPFRRTVIGNDVWIGENAMIKAGVTIGNGAVIGMGSVVTKDVGAYEIWAGNPARLIRKRFTDEIADRLQNSKWWDMDEETLKRLACRFERVEDFLEEAERIR